MQRHRLQGDPNLEEQKKASCFYLYIKNKHISDTQGDVRVEETLYKCPGQNSQRSNTECNNQKTVTLLCPVSEGLLKMLLESFSPAQISFMREHRIYHEF